MTDFPLLTTTRLTLRQLRYSDADAMLTVRGDAHAMRLMGRDTLQNLEEANQQIAHFLAETKGPIPAYRWALERNEDNAFLGTCGIFGWVKQWRKATIGYELGRFAWGNGYMHEATSSILTWAFEAMALHRMDALIHPDNHASLALAKRLGFKLEGRLRETAFWNETHHDMLQLGLLKAEMI